MVGYVAGSVTAKIELDTTDFDNKIKGLKSKVDDLKVTLQKNGLSDVSKQLQKFQETISTQQETIDKLKTTTENYKKQLKSLRNELKTGTTASKKNKNAIKELANETEKYNESVVKVSESQRLLAQNYEQIKNATYLGKQVAVFKEIEKATDSATAATKRYMTAAGKELEQTLKKSRELNKNAVGNKVYYGGIPGTAPKASIALNGYEIPKKKLQDFLKVFADAPIQVNRSSEEIDNAIRKFSQHDYFENPKRHLNNYLKTWANATLQVKRSAAEIEAGISKFAKFDVVAGTTERFQQSLYYLAKGIKYANTEGDRFTSTSQKIIQNLSKMAKANETNINSFEKQQKNIKYVHTGLDKLNNSFVKTTNVLKQFNFALIEGIDKESIFYQRTVQLASAMHKLNSGVGTRGVNTEYQGRQITGGYSNYISSIDKINQSLGKQSEKYKLVNGYQQKFKGYTDQATSSLTRLNNTLKKNPTDTLGRGMRYVNKETLRARYGVDTFGRGVKVVGDYTKVTSKDFDTMGKNLQTTSKNSEQANTGIRKTGTSMVNAAHSGRILSNTLYQIRGALLSLKMIFTAMGGMALWGFATEIAEGIKTTFTAKNEMEAQLKQNAKVGESGINTFNRALDETVSKFKKINKYSLGETVSSIGLEFELTSKQMEKAMPIVSMIQSEYVRAGRTSEEAALAVKDILQGEFQRLSRETGVGKEELIAYGWDEDKTNIDGLLKALDKAAKDRNWDLFAAKATSLNDVVQITKSRFEEFGADLLQSISPLIVSGFNALADGLDGLKKAFDGLGSFGKNSLLAGFAAGLASLIGTGLPMVSRSMGLADVATIGWSKSLGTAIFNLNKTTVAQYGFRKALAEVITGTKAEQLATVSSTKAIFGRILGINQSVMAQKGLLSALVAHKMELKGVEAGATRAAVANGKWYQKVEYLTAGFNTQGKVSDSLGKSLLRTATSWKVLRAAMLGVISIGIIAWYSSMATWADTVRKNIEGLNEVIDNGDSMLKEAKTNVSDYETALSKLTKGTDAYKKAANNLEVAKANEKDITTANKLAKIYKKQNAETEKNIANRHKMQMANSYALAGIDKTKASEMASGWTEKVKAGEQNWIDSMNIYNDRLYKSNQHINEHIELMNKANLSEEQKLKYIDEYSMKAEEVAENWKKFNQGDMNALAYAVLGELQLQWIDLWNNKHFINFWNSVTDTWENLKPTIWAIKDALFDLGNVMLDFFSTKQGQIIGGIALFGTAIGLVGLKIGKWVTGAKSTFDVLKQWGRILKDRIKDWKKLGDKVEEANEKMGGDKSTGGIKGEKADSWFNKSQIQGDVQKYTRAAVAIAAGMALITEAIVLLNAPMLALAGTGVVFEHTEPQIRAGIKGLQLIAPTIITLMTPTIALMYVLNKFNITSETLTKGFKDAAAGIALAITLVTEAIILLNAPLLGLAILGTVYDKVEDSVRQGIKAMDILNQSLRALVPWIPVFIGGIALIALAFAEPEIGIPALAATALGIGVGVLAVAEAIVGLNIPLGALAQTGQNYSDAELANVQRGAEAMKLTSEALGYVEEGVRAMMVVKWEMLAGNLADLVSQLMGHNIGDDLVKLTEDGGFLDQMEEFAKGFNSKTFTVIDTEKATAFKTVAESLSSLNDALEAAKSAIENLPQEFKNGGASTFAEQYQQNATSEGATVDTEGYFDQLKQPIEDLAKFMEWFNNLEIPDANGDNVTALTNSASMVEQINAAVEKVKNTMGNIAMGNVATNIAQTTGSGGWGLLGAINPFASLGMGVATGGSGDYKSSIGSQLYEMEMVLTDLTTFNNKISSLGGSDGGGAFTDGGGNADALAGMVTAVSDAISQLESTLAQAVPNITQNATNIGTGIKNGIKTGMGDLTQLIIPPFVTAMTTMKSYAFTYGKGVGYQGTQGFKAEFKIKDAVAEELQYALKEMENKKQEFYDKGYALGEASAKGFKDGDDSHSPGIMARTMFDEINYIETAMTNAVPTFTNQAYALGETLASNFNPSLGLGGLSADDLSSFQTGLDQISYMANSTDTQTSTAFTNMSLTANNSMTGMTTSINGAFNNIQQNTTTKYGQIVNTTKNSLNNMQTQTTKNITAIKTSWKGMQTALIASAEHIRSETTSKINTLQTNMGQFWKKIKNPETLIASAGGHTGTRRRNVPHKLNPRKYAGGTSPSKKSIGLFKTPTKSNIEPSSNIAEYLKCLLTTGKPCYAGGWDYNWTPRIMKMLKGWNTHFGKYNLDKHLNVGKFENSNFPVRGMADVARDYIFDVIRGTKYSFYYDSHYGNDPVAALRAGAFNCWDGTNVVLALARAFGFNGDRVYGSWNGTGHVWARIPGIGDIDATSIQQRGTFTAPDAVKGYAGGTLPRRHSDGATQQMGNSFGDVVFNVTINGNVDDAEETGKQIADEAGKQFINMFRRSPATGL